VCQTTFVSASICVTEKTAVVVTNRVIRVAPGTVTVLVAVLWHFQPSEPITTVKTHTVLPA
jgi:hypothetical protein